VLGGVYTDVEKTMIEIQRSTMVQETRNAFQNAMQDKFISAVENLSGRHVLASSQIIMSARISRLNSSSSARTASSARRENPGEAPPVSGLIGVG
jgi:hypothetical protein